MAGKRVRLTIDGQFLDNNFSHLRGTEGFIDALSSDPEWLPVRSRSLNHRVELINRCWQVATKGSPCRGYPEIPGAPPAFLPYLCLLCLAWTIPPPEGCTGANFYDRLTELYPDHGLGSNQMREWGKYWELLEKWTRNQDDQVGIFRVERLGHFGYVGLPKAQVILPWHKIGILPDLLYRVHLRPDDHHDKDKVKRNLVAAETTTRQMLSAIYPEIVGNTPIGKSAVELICEFMEDWDGRPNPSNAINRAANGDLSIPALRVIEIINDSDPTISIYLGLLDPPFRPSNGAIHKSGKLFLLNLIPPYTLCSNNSEPLTIEYIDNSSGQNRSAKISKPIKQIYLFPTSGLIDGKFLTEATNIPSCGGCWILVSDKLSAAWENWKIDQDVAAKPLDIKGIPQEWTLECIPNMEKLTRRALDTFPGSVFSPTKPRLFALEGGSLIRAGFHHSYLTFDPPYITQLGAEVRFDLIGGVLEPIDMTTSSQYQDEELKTFRIKLDEDASIVIIRATCGDLEQSMTLGFRRELQNLVADTTEFQLNRFGENTSSDSSESCRGLIITKSDRTTKAEINSLLFNSPSEIDRSLYPFTEKHLESRGVLFLESLAAGSQKISMGEFRRKAERIAGVSSFDFSQETRLLRDLCYIEIEIDRAGRWQAIHTNSPAFNLLPQLTSKGKYIAALTGIYNRELLEQLVSDGGQSSIEILVSASSHSMIPPTLYIVSDKMEALASFADSHHLPMPTVPPALALADWSSSLSDWEDSVPGRLRDGFGNTPADFVYNAMNFRFEQAKALHAAKQGGSFTRERFEDPLTGAHRVFRIRHNDRVYDVAGHFLALDQSWAKWKIQWNACAGEWKTDEPLNSYDLVPVFTKDEDRSLYIQGELMLPLILSRALALASSIPPEKVRQHQNPYSTIAGDFSQRSKTGGAAWRYRHVPKSVAELILMKVCALPVPRKSLCVTI